MKRSRRTTRKVMGQFTSTQKTNYEIAAKRLRNMLKKYDELAADGKCTFDSSDLKAILDYAKEQNNCRYSALATIKTAMEYAAAVGYQAGLNHQKSMERMDSLCN